MQSKSLLFGKIFILFAFFVSCSQSPVQIPPKVFPVKVARVEQQDVPVYLEAIGNVSAPNNVEMRPQIKGTIIDVLFSGGDDVDAGDVLYRLDPLPYQLALERAEANLVKDQAALEYAHRKIERYSTLLKNNFVSKLSIEEYKRDVRSLEAQIAIDQAEIGTAQTNLDYTTIVAPLKGRISLSKVDRGNVISPENTQPLANILQIVPIYVYFSIPQTEFEQLQQQLLLQDYSFTVILPGTQQEFQGNVIAFDNQVDSKTGTIRIKGIVANEAKILWPGEFVQVRVLLYVKKKAAIVPQQAVQIGQKGSYVYLLQDDQTVKYVSVETGERIGENIVINTGVKIGDSIVTDGQINLQPDAKLW
jgi:multidrug efflux system membrane fusion protein